MRKKEKKMYKDKKGSKYYIIRVEVIWGIAIYVILMLLVIFSGKGWIGKEENEREQKKDMSMITVTFEDMRSELMDRRQCYLCGNSDRSLIKYYQKFGTIGMISLNDWYILNFPLKKCEGKEKESLEANTDCSLYGNTGEIIYLCSGTKSRGMAKIDVTLAEDAELNTEIMRKNLCQECLDKVSGSLEYWKRQDEEKEAVPLCLVDFETLDIYPVQNMYASYFIRDYWIEIDFNENKVEVEGFYLPER